MSLKCKLPNGYWRNSNNQREFLLNFARKFNLKNVEEWTQVTQKQIEKEGGIGLFNRFGRNMKRMIETVFPEYNVKSLNFSKKLPSEYWSDPKNQKQFLLNFAKKNKIKSIADWEKVTLRQIKEAGGIGLLDRFGRSPMKMLQFVFPEYKFTFLPKKRKNYWSELTNQREFLNQVAKKYNVKKKTDWENIAVKQIEELGGATVTTKYGRSLKRMVTAVFPDEDFESVKFFEKSPNEYWNDPNRQREFLNQFARRNQVKEPKDWGKITLRQIEEAGGVGILNKYGRSPRRMIQSVFPNILWKPEWFFRVRKFPIGYWNSKSNCIEFMTRISSKVGIVHAEDWKRISISFIKKQGGWGLVCKYGGSVSRVLKALYPTCSWDLNLNFSVPQRQLEHYIKKVFPDEHVFANQRNKLRFVLGIKL